MQIIKDFYILVKAGETKSVVGANSKKITNSFLISILQGNNIHEVDFRYSSLQNTRKKISDTQRLFFKKLPTYDCILVMVSIRPYVTSGLTLWVFDQNVIKQRYFFTDQTSVSANVYTMACTYNIF